MELLKGFNLRIVEDERGSSQELDHLASMNTPVTAGFINQHGFNLIHQDHEVYKVFSDIDYLYRDGVGMKFALTVFGQRYGLNMNGTDFIPKLCARFLEMNSRATVYCFGTEEPWLSKGAETLLGSSSNEIVVMDGFQSDSSYLDAISHDETPKSAVLIVLAMGMPKQERIAKLLKSRLKGRSLIICGGAILDFQAGKVRRAPGIFQRFGLEWLYRLATEPRRMFNRYVIGIPKFFGHILKLRYFNS